MIQAGKRANEKPQLENPQFHFI